MQLLTRKSKQRVPATAGGETLHYVSLLLPVPNGSTVEYAELAKALGQELNRSRLRTARHILLRDHGVVFSCVKGVGLKRCTNTEVLDVSAGSIKKIQRAGKRGRLVNECVKIQDLPPPQQARCIMVRTMTGFAEDAYKTHKTKKIEQIAARTQKAIPFTRLLDAFKEEEE